MARMRWFGICSVILLLTAGRVLAQDATPSPTPTATPPPEGSETLTAQISDGADDVNESAQTLTADAREVWIGNGDSLEGHYLGLRFQGVVIPRGSRILSAHLEFYTASDQWILVDVNIAAEASGDSLAFAPDNLPSQRALTQAVVHHQSDVLWPAETWQAFDEMAEVIQEVIDGPGWRSGHNLSVILNGAPTGSLFARKYVSAFEDAPVRAPRLAVLFLPPDAPDPTPTPAPTLTPSPTLTPTPAECNPDLPERLVVGQQGRVVFTAEGANTPLNVRAAPGTGGERLARLAASVTFEVVNGPVCADGLAWFEVEYGSPAERGWIAEGQGGRYFVEPVE